MCSYSCAFSIQTIHLSQSTLLLVQTADNKMHMNTTNKRMHTRTQSNDADTA